MVIMISQRHHLQSTFVVRQMKHQILYIAITNNSKWSTFNKTGAKPLKELLAVTCVSQEHSAVSVITMLQVGRPRIRGSIPSRGSNTSFPQRPVSGTHRTSSPMATRFHHRGLWRPLTSSSWRNLTTRGCTRPLPKVYMPWYLTKNRDNCKFS
jgi:hypothetical protein